MKFAFEVFNFPLFFLIYSIFTQQIYLSFFIAIILHLSPDIVAPIKAVQLYLKLKS